MGTEKIEDAVQKLFPDANIARLDRDTTSRKGSVLKILKGVRNRSIDILIGTQMVAKGHDFPDITLVGIICADVSLNFPDFRAGERTFQLLAQVSGRAGRGKTPGKVILQTYNPAHFTITAAREQNIEAFYNHEIRFRESLSYPPFSRLIQLRISGTDLEKTRYWAKTIGESCRFLRMDQKSDFKRVEILGPVEAPMPKLSGKYRWQILLKSASIKQLHGFARDLLFGKLHQVPRRSVQMVIDVDPLFMT